MELKLSDRIVDETDEYEADEGDLRIREPIAQGTRAVPAGLFCRPYRDRVLAFGVNRTTV